MDSKTGSVDHRMVFGSLVVLVLLSVGISLLHALIWMTNLSIFAIALLMAGLVVSQYMGLRFEGRWVIWTLTVPLILFAILVFAMMPDIAHVPVYFLGQKH